MKNKKDTKIKIGDRVWLTIPHNGKVEFIYKDGSLRIELDEILPKTLMSRFSKNEVRKI